MTDVDPTDPTSYDHWVVERVRFSDTDALGHVNNVAIAAYVESGRVAYGAALGERGFTATRVILRRLEIDYLGEIFYPDRLDVGSRLLHVGRTSFTIGTGVFRDGRCVATASGVLVVLGRDGPAELSDADRRLLGEGS